MGEKILGWIEQIATGRKARLFWAIVIILILVAFIAFPYIDANILFYGRIEKRVDNLQKLVAISGQPIANEPSLMAEYQSILIEMETAREKSVAGTYDRSNTVFDSRVKFWSGALLGFIIALIGLFSKNPNGHVTFRFFLKNNMMIFLVGMVIGSVSGCLFARIPTIGTVWINAVASPIIQFIFWDLLLSKPKRKI